MGNDGGSIPDRRDLVRSKPKAEKADKANQTRARWFFCALSKRKLQEPITSCGLGKLYNKDAILEYLLDKSSYGDGEEICGHIRSSKDVKTLVLTPNASPKTSSPDEDFAQFMCPFTMKEMNGSQTFIYIWTCGCVMSQAGFKTLSSATSTSTPPSDYDSSTPKESATSLDLCPQCSAKYSAATDVIILNTSPEEEAEMRNKLEARRLASSTKLSKKRKAEADEPPSANTPTTKKQNIKKTVSPHMNPAVAAASRAVVESLAVEEAKRNPRMSEAVKSVYRSKDRPERKETFMTMNTFTRYA